MASDQQNSKKLKFVPEQKQQQQLTQQSRDWLELPPEITINILHRIGVVDILENIRKVCTTWHKICKDPAMWRVIRMEDYADIHTRPPLLHDPHESLREMCKHAVDRSHGQLVDITIVGFGDDDLLLYIADRSSKLRRLEIACCHFNIYESWTEALEKFPLLEELSLYLTPLSEEAIEIAGRCCPKLKTVKVNQEPYVIRSDMDDDAVCNETAIAIGENFREVRHLELIGNRMTNIGLQTILDGCHHLESLDLRLCLNIDLKGGLGQRCSEQTKCLKLPSDSLEGSPYTIYCATSCDFTCDPNYDAFFII